MEIKTNRTPEVSPMSSIREGNPLTFINGDALPPIISVMGPSALLKLEVIGRLVATENGTVFAVSRIELK